MRPGLLALLLASYAFFGVLVAIALIGAILPWLGVPSGTVTVSGAIRASAGSSLFAFAMMVALVALDRARHRRGLVFRHPRPVRRPIDFF